MYSQRIEIWQQVVAGYLQVLPERCPEANENNHEDWGREAFKTTRKE